jgi:diguanylate cyclase (GGDEF)-like protein
MRKDGLRLYSALSGVPFPKSYPGKVFFAAFLGTHIPLLALVAHLVRDPRVGPRERARILAVALVATLGGTAGTLWALHALLGPVSAASEALRRYLEQGEVPNLPTSYPDRAGRLMANVQHSVERLDAALSSLGEQATRDHLTGLLNRRAAEERLAQDVARAEREGAAEGAAPGTAFTLAVVDLDQFKPVNDLHGHPAGDACLVRFAAALARNARKGDWVARWGGDEFVVGAWDAEGRGAERILGRVDRELRASPLALPNGKEARLSFGAGVARWRDGDDAQGLLRRADGALYRAKAEEGGKNVVVHAD